METTIAYWGCIGMMEKKMDTTIVILGLYRDNGKENGNYYGILGLYWVYLTATQAMMAFLSCVVGHYVPGPR